MKVIIIGAGIGGTSAGIALRRLGHDVVIYDRMRENKPVGAALSLWSNGVKVLNWLGLRDEVAALGGDMATMAYRDGITGEVLCDFSLDPVTAQTGQKPYPVARADLQALLMRTFGEDDIHLGRQVVAHRAAPAGAADAPVGGRARAAHHHLSIPLGYCRRARRPHDGGTARC